LHGIFLLTILITAFSLTLYIDCGFCRTNPAIGCQIATNADKGQKLCAASVDASIPFL